jgi:uncharacterized protein (TIGR02145 family)
LSTQNLSYREIASRISGDVTVNADFPVVKAEAGADIALASGSDEFSSNWVLSVMNLAKSHVLTGIGGASGLTLSTQGQSVANQSLNDSALLRAVGDEFVTEIEYSTQLFVSMKAEYLSTSDKDAINGHISVDFALGNVSGDLQYLSEEQKQSVSITVRAHQFGGDPLNLLTIIPDNIVTCNLTNFTPCETLFEEAIKYAKGIGQYDGIGFKDQVADVSNSNIVGYKTEKYDANFGTYALAPASPYTFDDNTAIIDVLEDEYVDQLEAQNRASGLLSKSLAYLNTTQRGALRSTTTVALNNAEALRDLINYCDINVYNSDCNSYIAAECPVDGASRSCIKEYSTKIFDLVNLNDLQLMTQQYSQLVSPNAMHDIGVTLLRDPDGEVWSPTATQPSYDKTSGKLSVDLGFQLSSSGTGTGEFMVKANKKMSGGVWIMSSNTQSSDSSYKVSVYADGKWQMVQDSSVSGHTNDIDYDLLDTADAVDGHYYYHYTLSNVDSPLIDMLAASWNNVELYFYQKSTHTTAMTTGLGQDNTPFYFSTANIELDKDLDGADIGWCPTGSSLQRGTNDDCRDSGRRYTWAEAAKACAAFSEANEAQTGLLWSLPTTDDVDAFVERVEQQSGAGNAGSWLKAYHFVLNSGVHGTNNALGFSWQRTGLIFNGWTPSNAKLYYKGFYAYNWLADEASATSGMTMTVDSGTNTDVGQYSANKNMLLATRCIGKYAK